MTLPRKQRGTQAGWDAAWHNAQVDRDLPRALGLVEAAAERLQRTMDGLGATSAIYSWSGGKDSQVCRAVAHAAGYGARGVCVLTRGLEYPAFLDWVVENLPGTCQVHTRPHDLDWLAGHPSWLFPTDAGMAGRWFRQVQHAGQRSAMRAESADALLMGRRAADGNYCGTGGMYRDRAGFWRVSPIHDWSHEDVLCVLAAYQLPLPPCYGWPEGWRVATGPWAKRRRHPDGLDATWQLVRTIDPDVVAAAARAGIPGAALALSTPAEATR